MTLTQKALEARRAYRRAWAKQNPDKVKASQARYWERKAQEALNTTDEQNKQEQIEK